MENWRKFSFTDDKNYKISREIRTYEPTESGKSWRKNPSEIEKDDDVPAEWYTNYVTAIPFFNNWGDGAYCRGHRSYTCAGYLPTEVVTVAPFRKCKKVAVFTIERREKS